MSAYRRIASVVRTLNLDKPIHSMAGALCGVATDEAVFHLTFDDGPNPDVTPSVLDALDEFGAPATFFLLTSNAQEHPDLAQEILRRGHVIGLHSRTHPRLSHVSWQVLQDEILAARLDLEETIGARVTWFRPPYGVHGARSIAMTRKARLTTMLWTVDSRDYKGITTDPLERTRAVIKPGGVVLLHDRPVGDSLADDAAHGLIPKEELTRVYLRELADRRLRPVDADALFSSGRPLKKLKLG